MSVEVRETTSRAYSCGNAAAMYTPHASEKQRVMLEIRGHCVWMSVTDAAHAVSAMREMLDRVGDDHIAQLWDTNANGFRDRITKDVLA
jgi:hypothetical protein